MSYRFRQHLAFLNATLPFYAASAFDLASKAHALSDADHLSVSRPNGTTILW